MPGGGPPTGTPRAARWPRGSSRWRAAVPSNRIRSVAARQRAEAAAPPPDPPPGRDEPATHAADRQRTERVSAAMAALTPRQREVLELGYFGGLSQSEIAARLDAPLGTVKSWTRQGLMRLRQLVPQEETT